MSMTAEFAADAREYLRNERARREEYEADVEAWYRSGDGRSTRDGGRGYAYPYCIHGVSMWVDYDCACGQCEAGTDDLYAGALAYARRKSWDRARRQEAVNAATGALVDLCAHLRTMGASEADVAAVSVPVAKAIGRISRA